MDSLVLRAEQPHLVYQSLDAKDISQIRKNKMKEAHSKLTREITEENKAIEKAATKSATDAVNAFFTENPNARVCVLEVDAGGNAKALQVALGHVTKQYQRAAYLFTVDKEEGKVVHMNTLPKSDVSKTFNAKEWMSAISSIVGGRGGGRDDGAQGVGSEPSKVKEAVAEAKKLYEKAMGSL
jgi:alanyl-tRNA synthetase